MSGSRVFYRFVLLGGHRAGLQPAVRLRGSCKKGQVEDCARSVRIGGVLCAEFVSPSAPTHPATSTLTMSDETLCHA